MEAVMRSVERWPQTEKVWRQFARLDLVMERLSVDPARAARKSAGAALAEARNVCLSCRLQRECSQRLESGGDAAAILDFCPNAGFFRECGRRAPE
jgi:hypothetical protein